MSELAITNRIEVFYGTFSKHLIFSMEGWKHSSLNEVDVRKSPNRILPPQFEVVEIGDNPRKMTTWSLVKGVFAPEFEDPSISEVTIYHKDENGKDQVGDYPITRVNDIPTVGPVMESFTSEAAAQREYGVSMNLDFNEAFSNALSKILQSNQPAPGQKLTTQVADTGSTTITGFVGLSTTLYVALDWNLEQL